MKLPIVPPYPAMEAASVKRVPEGPGWLYEPKWDGFRCLVFRDGDEIELQSKAGQPLARYFPEVVEAVRSLSPRALVLDSELVVPVDGALSFDALLLRVHPAESRIRRLAAETPAVLLVFDLLVDERRRELVGETLAERRRRLEALAAGAFDGARIQLSPATTDRDVAMAWFGEVGAGLDGVVAKRLDEPYRSGERRGFVKVKKLRTADCVVGGFRYATGKPIVGSLLLGLYDEDGVLNHVGFNSSLSADERRSVTPRFEALAGGPGFTGRKPGGPSRWSGARSSEWTPLRPEIVVEVEYDHFSGDRFRHGTRFVRWRPDKRPDQCTLEQVGRAPAGALAGGVVRR